MIWNKDRIGAIFLLFFFIVYGLLSRNIDLLPVQHASAMSARTMPQALTLIGITAAMWLLIFPRESAPLRTVHLHWPRFICFLLLMSMYGLGLRPLGFVPATFLFLTGGFLLLGVRRPVLLVGVATAVAVGFWLLMEFGLGVYLTPWPSLSGPGN